MDQTTYASVRNSTAGKKSRIDAVDIARGLALLAMAIYHLSWDLFWFRLVDWDVARGAGWRTFAVAIAASFIFLVGVSLVLAHARSFRWKAIFIRFGKIALAAGAVTIGTWYALGDQFVRFGILHCIALSSLLALPFLRFPIFGAVAATAFVFSMPFWARAEVFNDPALLWTGLATAPPPAVDYVPMVPWFGFVLTGIALARIGKSFGLFDFLARWQARNVVWRGFAFAGRHSLAVYLLHQPLLYGLVWSMIALGLTNSPAEIDFTDNCRMSCSVSHDDADCKKICRCTLNTMKNEGTWVGLLANPQDDRLTTRMRDTYAMCEAREFSR
ncbi:DUF1624 domain-containing protein [Rhizobiales bacterium]|uniref:heparan-alpha-glucosaminide N-acetyltransferase n=1 Tax=Hongsoonwoonella zoysiae TaxID=2821844 RepID=UPI00155FF6B5|nr:heparan-alpha-glucosaminide N-acetyltransferase [Hongsoonwoonella zoysiae]NRG17694.1 DUF1624 domain-containing protein [Hongsoonwoonella zoysiae]